MKRLLMVRLLTLALLSNAWFCHGQQNRDTNRTPIEVLSSSVRKIVDMIDPPENAPPKTFYMTFEVRKAEGISKFFNDLSAKVALQLPERAWVSADIGDKSYSLGRYKQQLWIHSAVKQFTILGEHGQSRFTNEPALRDDTRLGPLAPPLDRAKVLLMPFIMDIEDRGFVDIEDLRCRLLSVSPKKEAREALKLPAFKLRLWLDTNDLPVRAGYTSEGPHADVQVWLNNLRVESPWADQRWQAPRRDDDEVERIALGHLASFIDVSIASFTERIPSLGKATGQRKIVASEGAGRLELIDGARVLFLKGSPEEIGHQHGVLLRKEIQEAKDQILYGLSVRSSLDKGKWFISEIESALNQLSPFMANDYLSEMNALASAAKIEPVEIRLANVFPELFHCSGFVVYGNATSTGKMYHGRVLDYFKGAGLEQNAVVMIVEPEGRNAWVNIGYAGFIGSVTAMNEKHLAIGEMGGRHEGEWEGKPMAELVREVMERAGTLDEALEIMKKTPRTCDYYYVISDGKSKRAVAVRGTPTKFEVVEAGKKHDKFPDPIENAVVVSEGKRYEELVKRLKEKHGKLDSDQCWEVMKPPVAMDSNIQTVLFAPETLDFRVANADSEKVASEGAFRKYNLAALLGRTNSVPHAVAVEKEKDFDPATAKADAQTTKPDEPKKQRRRRRP